MSDSNLTNEEIRLRQALEGFLFANGAALPCERLAELLEVSTTKVAETVKHLNAFYSENSSALEVRALEGSYILTTGAVVKPELEKLFKQGGKIRLSNQAYEVLAAVAYNQPCTRAQIELVRGVNSDHIINNLLDLDLIEKNGYLEMPGHPTLYSVTAKFLRLFGLTSVNELPAQALLMYDSLQQLNDQAAAAGIN